MKYLCTQLLLDFDCTEDEFKAYWVRWKSVFTIIKLIRFKSVIIRQTKKGFHVYMDIYNFQALTPQNINFLQLAFGSDYKRECFNQYRILSGVTLEWNVLFKRKWRYDESGSEIELSRETPRLDLELECKKYFN